MIIITIITSLYGITDTRDCPASAYYESPVSITVLRSKKMGILFPKWPGVNSTGQDKVE